MSDKIMDVRSCIDAAVSPEGLKTGGGGGGGERTIMSLSPQAGTKLELLNPSNASLIDMSYTETDVIGALSMNMALEVKEALTSSDADADGWIRLVTLSPIYPAGTTDGVLFCINGDNGKNYLGKHTTHYIYIKYVDDIPVGTTLIIDSTPILKF